MPSDFYPVPGDPDGVSVDKFIGMDQSWVLSDAGDLTTAAALSVDLVKNTHQPVVLIECAGRVNRTDELVKVRFALNPESAQLLLNNLVTTLSFFNQIDGGPDALRGKLPPFD